MYVPVIRGLTGIYDVKSVLMGLLLGINRMPWPCALM